MHTHSRTQLTLTHSGGLPRDIVFNIFKNYIPQRQLVRLRCVSKGFIAVASDPFLWTEIYCSTIRVGRKALEQVRALKRTVLQL